MSVKTYSIKRDGNVKLSANFTLKEMQSHDGATTADVEYIAMMSDIELDTEETEDENNEQ